VSKEFLLLLRLKNHSNKPIIPTRAMPPITPPTTGAGVNFGFEEIPAAAADSFAGAEAVVAVMEVVLRDDAKEANPSLDIPVDVGVTVTSLCAIGIEVLDDIVGVVPFDAGEADVDVSLVLVLEAAAGVTVSTGVTDVVIAAAGDVEEVVVSGSVVVAIEDVGAALDVEMAETATLGELP
jgi:hypothetical protein